MDLFTLPPHIPFLDAIAAEWLVDAGSDPMRVADGIILLPTRRAARALAEAFLRVSNGRALLLPRIVAIGALDETPLALAGTLDLPPAIDPLERTAHLARLILAMRGDSGAPRFADGAWPLATELADLMDEAARAEITLKDTLPRAAASDYAEHWQKTLQFLSIVTQAWPAWLGERAAMDPGARAVALLHAQAAAWECDPPIHRVLLAGITAPYPALTHLARVVADLPRGAVLLPGLDTAMDPGAWRALTSVHPQAGMRDLLSMLEVTREQVRAWPLVTNGGVPPSRPAILHQALRPTGAFAPLNEPEPPKQIWSLSADDEQQEATAIALILRDALETPGARAALVTPDRALAGAVAAALARFGVIADDSAGEPLSETPPAVFLRLLSQAVAAELAPVPLLALLKHPMAALGLDPPACRAAARALERVCLRGPRPAGGINGLRQALAHAHRQSPEAADLLARLERRLAPLLRMVAAMEESPATWLGALIESAELLAATDRDPGATRIWAMEEGDALATHLTRVLRAFEVLPAQRPEHLPGLLDAALQGVVVRTRRALRGRPGAEHPRVFIWGLLEARLQSAEVIVLGGLVEGVWPPLPDPGPWLSRPMRDAIGLPPPERLVGQAAHDFVGAACAASTVVLSAPKRRDRAPAVPARWLVRLNAALGEQALPQHEAAEWARGLDQPAGPPCPVAPPRPRPPLRLRPRTLSVTEIETWIRDPYAIHARHVLKLRPLDELEEDTDAADYGQLVHRGMQIFLQEATAGWPADPAERLRAAMLTALVSARLRPALTRWWAPRLERIAGFVAETEQERRADGGWETLLTEVSGQWEAANGFVLRGRADRIERRRDGTISILDYKTGRVPKQGEVEDGRAPQLPLEAAMAEAGAFTGLHGTVDELVYWKLTGRADPGEVCTLFKRDAARVADVVRLAADRLRELVALFDDRDTPYLAQPHPGLAPVRSDFAQLARVAEWAAARDEE